MNDEVDIDQLDYENMLHGKTLQCYYYLLRHPTGVGVRKLQRDLGFSSPSIAAHHLNKLVEWELCQKRDDNKYELKKVVSFGVLKHFVYIQNMFIPRFSFYLGFYVVMIIGYVILRLTRDLSLKFIELIFIINSLSIIFILVYETRKSLKLLSFYG